jgi:methionyl-tRNA formyltransferase
MRVVFFGTPEPAARALDELLASRHEIVAVVTQPDRPRGRSATPQPPPVKVGAEAASLPVMQPSSPKDDGFEAALGAYAPDVCAVVAYGHLLPTNVLAVPPRGFINVHFSLLPAYRGAAPVQRAIMAGETETGVTTFLLEPAFDTGPILQQTRVPIAPDDTTGTLLERLSDEGARLLVRTLDALETGRIEPRTQDAALASPAPKIRPEEAMIDWTKPAPALIDQIRAFAPALGAFGTFRGKRLKVWRAVRYEGTLPSAAQPGAVIDAGRERLVVATGDGAVELLEIQPEGGKRLSSAEFIRGYRPTTEETFVTFDSEETGR